MRPDAHNEEELERHPEAVQPAAPEHAVRRQPCTGWPSLGFADLGCSASSHISAAYCSADKRADASVPACQHRTCSSSLPVATAPCKDLQLPATAILQHPRRSRCRHMDQGHSVSMCQYVCSSWCTATRPMNTPSDVEIAAMHAGLISRLDSGHYHVCVSCVCVSRSTSRCWLHGVR
jgi:hypothetical protein